MIQGLAMYKLFMFPVNNNDENYFQEKANWILTTSIPWLTSISCKFRPCVFDLVRHEPNQIICWAASGSENQQTKSAKILQSRSYGKSDFNWQLYLQQQIISTIFQSVTEKKREKRRGKEERCHHWPLPRSTAGHKEKSLHNRERIENRDTVVS